jgi:hypothetical protein
MEKRQKKGGKGKKGKIALKDLDVGKVKGGVEIEDPKGGLFDVFSKFEGAHKIDPAGKHSDLKGAQIPPGIFPKLGR